MMSNNSIGLQRLKPVHTAYGAICMPIRKLLMHWHNLAENYSWARDVNGPETETLTIFLETRPRRDVGTSRESRPSRDRDVETETTTLPKMRLRPANTVVYE